MVTQTTYLGRFIDGGSDSVDCLVMVFYFQYVTLSRCTMSL